MCKHTYGGKEAATAGAPVGLLLFYVTPTWAESYTFIY